MNNCSNHYQEETEYLPQTSPNFDVDQVTGSIDYDKLFDLFGTDHIDDALIQRIKTITSKDVHPFLKRGLFFSHRDMSELLDDYEQGNSFYLYTGIGPSSEAMHIGHLVPFLITQYLQEAFGVPVVIQVTDDEKYLKKDLSMAAIDRMCHENIKDIIACGFDIENTFIFRNTEYIGQLYQNVLQVQKRVNCNQIKGIFGLSMSYNIGRVSFPAIQAAPAFSSTFYGSVFPENTKLKCLIPCGIDQDNYFRMTRDVARRIDEFKPALLHSKFIPALQGVDKKMSSSDPLSSIFLTDDRESIKAKIFKHSYSGGGSTMKEHRENGANLEVDIAYIYLQEFLYDDQEIENIGIAYGNGEIGSGVVKGRAVEVLGDLIESHQQRRCMITDEVYSEFTRSRILSYFK
eukprot:TRINITY_DN7946_c0_g1_i1.p1 TRINITY_DN7946_c0_g1~~TRINITY_DN7946_c0_g1_i1.p1  ORF type:complete len:402 (+),score=66.82 TRINITY_DN7946_c0_g1_i1:268-1473(+)